MVNAVRLRRMWRKFTLLNFLKGTLFNRVNILIRGGLLNMRLEGVFTLSCEGCSGVSGRLPPENERKGKQAGW